MATELFTNNTSTTVSSGGTTAPASGTTETWTVASSASFPAVTTGAGTQFHVADPALPAEKILVTNITGTTWSVTRGAETTTPVAHASGFTINQVVTAGVLTSFPQLGVSNTFTAEQAVNIGSAGVAVAVGANPATFTTGLTQFYNEGHIVMGNNGGAPPAHSPPFIHLIGYCGGATGLNGWDFGIDVANHGGGQDFYFGKLTNTGTTDFIYINYATTAIGIGSATPPDDTHLLEIRSEASDTMGCLKLELGGSATGNVLTLAASSDASQIWVDNLFWVNTVAGGPGLQVRGEATADIGMTIANNAKTKQYTLSSLNSGNVFELKYFTGGTSIFWGHTDGSLELLHNVKINGGVQLGHNVKSGNYTATTGDSIIGCFTSGGVLTITLPGPPSGSQVYIIKDEGGAAATHNITIATTGGKTIDGAATATISANYGAVRVYTDGTNWFTF